MSKKKVIETHGKVDSAQPTMLEQVWGYNELSRYGTNDADAYASKLDEMNRPDLERHARTVGVLVVESTARLKDNLKKAFANYYISLRKPATISTTDTKPVSEEVRKILAEGR